MTRPIAGHSDVPGVWRPRGRRGGFTIVELLTAIAVILILTAIVLVVGSRVLTGQRENQTQSVLVALDRALDEYHTTLRSFPIYDPDDYEDVPWDDNGPQNYMGEPHVARPDAAVFLKQARGVGQVDIVTSLPERFLTLTSVDQTASGADLTPSVVDSWSKSPWPGSPSEFPIDQQQVIYYVHPENLLAQDLYGRCVNGRPYFMSAGPDEKYGLRNDRPHQSDPVTVEEAEGFVADNIYSYPVGPFKTGMPAPARSWSPN